MKSKPTITSGVITEVPPSRQKWDIVIHGTLFFVGTSDKGETGMNYIRLDGTTIANGGKFTARFSDDCELVVQMRRPKEYRKKKWDERDDG